MEHTRWQLECLKLKCTHRRRTHWLTRSTMDGGGGGVSCISINSFTNCLYVLYTRIMFVILNVIRSIRLLLTLHARARYSSLASLPAFYLAFPIFTYIYLTWALWRARARAHDPIDWAGWLAGYFPPHQILNLFRHMI